MSDPASVDILACITCSSGTSIQRPTRKSPSFLMKRSWVCMLASSTSASSSHQSVHHKDRQWLQPGASVNPAESPREWKSLVASCSGEIPSITTTRSHLRPCVVVSTCTFKSVHEWICTTGDSALHVGVAKLKLIVGLMAIYTFVCIPCPRCRSYTLDKIVLRCGMCASNTLIVQSMPLTGHRRLLRLLPQVDTG